MAGEIDYNAMYQQLHAIDKPSIVPTVSGKPAEDKAWYKKAYDFMSGKDEIEGLQERGMSTEGAPLGIRAAGSRTTDTVSRAIDTMKQFDPATEFKLDKPTRRMAYREPGMDKFNIIDPPGMDFGDWAEMFGDVPALTGEAIGYMLAKRIPGGNKIVQAGKKILGIGGGAAFGEAAREKINIERGAYDHLTEEEKTTKLINEPAKAAGLALSGAGGSRAVGGTYKYGKSLLSGEKIPKAFVERGLKLPDEVPAVVKEVNDFLAAAGSKKKFNPNSAQVLNDPEFGEVVRRYTIEKGMEGHSAVRKFYEANQDSLDELADLVVGKELAGDAAGYEAGRAIEGVLEGQASSAESAMAGRVTQAEQAAEMAAADVEQAAGRKSSDEGLGETLRDVPEQERLAIQAAGKKLYDPIKKEVAGDRFYQENLRREVDRQKGLFDMDIGGDFLAPENKRLIEAIRKDVTVMRETPSGGAYKATATADHDIQSRLVSNLKRLEREIDKGNMPDLEKAAVTDLKLAAMADRTARYAAHDATHGTQLVRLQGEADAAYRTMKNKMQGTLGRLMAWSGGRPRIKNEKVFSTVFGPDKTTATASREFSDVLLDPKHNVALEEMKGAIFRDFFEATTGKSPAVAQKWLKDRAQNLDNYLSLDELTILGKAKNSAEGLEKLAARQKAFKKALDSSVGSEFRGSKPSKIFKQA